jgi:catechol 2,3-dioxygenase-like lactoylglutathione lyase family enzyme
MFDHLSIGVVNLDQSLAFYDATLQPLGISQMFALSDSPQQP